MDSTVPVHIVPRLRNVVDLQAWRAMRDAREAREYPPAAAKALCAACGATAVPDDDPLATAQRLNADFWASASPADRARRDELLRRARLAQPEEYDPLARTQQLSASARAFASPEVRGYLAKLDAGDYSFLEEKPHNLNR
jgi:hypothetical protein